MEEPTGEATAPLAVKQMCRRSLVGPAESETVPAPGEGAEHCLAASTRCLPLASQGPSEQGQEQQPTLGTSQSPAFQKSEGQVSSPRGGSTSGPVGIQSIF